MLIIVENMLCEMIYKIIETISSCRNLSVDIGNSRNTVDYKIDIY